MIFYLEEASDYEHQRYCNYLWRYFLFFSSWKYRILTSFPGFKANNVIIIIIIIILSRTWNLLWRP